VREVEETTGPWDSADAPDDGIARVDLGSLRLPAVPGTELRVDVNAQQKVVGATLRYGDSLLQVAVFAAPAPAASGTTSAPTSPAAPPVRAGR
jgi:hypothetical protein